MYGASIVVNDTLCNVWSQNIETIEQAEELLVKVREMAAKANHETIWIDEYTDSQKGFWMELGAFTSLRHPHRFIFLTHHK